MRILEIFDTQHELISNEYTRRLEKWLSDRNVDEELHVYASRTDSSQVFVEVKQPDGYWEIHHTTIFKGKHYSGSRVKDIGSQPNTAKATKYLTTAIQLYKNKLDSGEKIRLIVTDKSGMLPLYQRIIKRLIQSNENKYIVGEPQIYSGKSSSVSITIEPKT
jgi:hypothetical protein